MASDNRHCCVISPVLRCEKCGKEVCATHWWKIYGKNLCPECANGVSSRPREEE